MKITFELNPPKILKDQFTKRASELVDLGDGIHLTDSALGIPRISSVTAANLIKRTGNPLMNREPDDTC